MTERQLTNAQKELQTTRKIKNIRARINQLLENQYGKINAKTYNTIYRKANNETNLNKLEKTENQLISLIPLAVDRRKAQIKKTTERRAFKNHERSENHEAFEEDFEKLYDRYVDEDEAKENDDGFIEMYNENYDDETKKIISPKAKNEYTVYVKIWVDRKYKEDGKLYEKYEMEEHEEVFEASNMDDLEQQVNDLVQSKFPFYDSGWVAYYNSHEWKVVETIDKKVNKMDVRMKRAIPYTASFLRHFDSISPYSYENHDDECVLKYFVKHMQGKYSLKSITNLFNEASNAIYQCDYEKGQGITAKMIEYFCKDRNMSCLGFCQDNKLFVKTQQDDTKSKSYRAIVFYMFMGHFYAIDDAKTIASLSQQCKEGGVFISNMNNDDKENDKPKETYYNSMSLKKCLKLPPDSVVIFNQHDLNDLFKNYIETDIDNHKDIPAVKLRSRETITEFKTKNGVKLVCDANFQEHISWQDIQSICNKMDLPFHNQSFGNIVMEMTEKFYETPRVLIPKETKDLLLQQQKDKCNDCQKKIEKKKYHIDHIRPLSNGGNNDIENLQLLCVSCHLDKTRHEHDEGIHSKICDFESSFNLEAYATINSKHFTKYAFTQTINDGDFSGKKLQCLDLNKCRRNILLHTLYNFCCYSVLDNIEPFDGNITDGFYFIESNNVFPLRKNGFYSKPMVDYVLLKKIIVVEQIKYQFKPTFKIPAHYFTGLIEHLINAFQYWTDMKCLNDYAKLAVNTLIGLFGRRNNKILRSCICNRNEIDDIACHYQDFNKPRLFNVNDDVCIITDEQEIQKLTSYHPIHAQILDIEAIELHKLVNKVINHGSIPVCVKTDAVIFAVNPKKAPIDISNEFWDEAKTVSKLKYDEKVELLERSILTNTEASVFELKPKDYKEYDEANIYADNNYDNIVNTVIQSKEGCLVNGLAGTGKTFLLNNMVKQINATLATKTVVVKQGKKQVKKTVVLEQIRRLAPTNVSALLIDGETLDKFTHSISNGKLNKFKNIKYIFVDEISMVREQFIKTLLLIKHGFPNIKFIISGDFNQLEPVLDRDKVLSNANRVNKYFDYKNSRALFELVDGNKLELTRCKRSDNFLFEICKDAIKNIPIDISQFNRPIETYLNICHTNDTRKK